MHNSCFGLVSFIQVQSVMLAVYDVTRRETLDSLSDSWMFELERYQLHPDVARMVVANKVDQVRPWDKRGSTAAQLESWWAGYL